MEKPMSAPSAKGFTEDSDFSDDEYTQLQGDTFGINQQTAQETKGWNVFREIPLKAESSSMDTTPWILTSLKVMKLLAYILIFIFVLGSAALSKGTILFMTSQLKKDRQIAHCNKQLGLDKQFVTFLPTEERVAWLWCILFAFAVPELGTFLRSFRIRFFKSAPSPTMAQFLLVFATESLHTIGTALLLLVILPELDVVKGAMLTNCMCFFPAVLNALSRNPEEPNYTMKIVLDVLAISAQVTGFVVWPLLDGTACLWMIPVACLFISIGWWENFVDRTSNFRFMKVLCRLKQEMKRSRYNTYSYIPLWNIVLFFVCAVISMQTGGDSAKDFFKSTGIMFSERNYTAQEVLVVIEDAYNGFVNLTLTDTSFVLPINWTSPLWVLLIQVASGYICYSSGKLACKILIQSFSFSFALTLVVPVVINILIVMCGLRNGDPCAFHGMIPDYLFYNIPPVYLLSEYIGKQMAWVWLLWLLSQVWITMHTWLPKCERLAVTEKLFAKPWYNGILVDQSMLLNRSKDENVNIELEDLKRLKDDLIDTMSVNSDMSGSIPKDIKSSDYITRIYVCATMWHEIKDEMMEFLKSIIRLDEDQCARRVAQKYLRVVDPDYYELETHIFMDDAFEVSDHSSEDSQVNRFVKLLVDTVNDAASEVHSTNVRLRPPKKYPTPYGGRLEWTMPGKTKLICHLKDKIKIRHRKRWSQVMYMYYFLGHRLMDVPISVDRKEVIAENTYLLALDGDIDFQPNAVTRLIDLMKKNKNLGAACGRIHPVGSGPMAWYQMFEYAIGHWLQKATEHMIGCVLCSPGCFSLFRGKALMDDNVMRKYTLMSSEAKHYVQYDQGEDRWLCTLLLQRGYRVEYSATSDAYTHCPEGFSEFYNQRRRWVPSTMANILDLLGDAKNTIAVNDNISRLYIVYHGMLMGGAILGPGTIFLMMVGALVAAFGLSNINALYINLIPVALFLAVCMTCKSEVQLFLAGAITCFYGLVMTAVILGIALQIVEDGWLAPASMFTVATIAIFVISALLHPQEINCLLYIVVYYITIPSMYMLLIIYSLCNMNNVSWGTREVAQKKTAKEIENENKEAEEAKKIKENKSLLSRFGHKTDENSGTLEIGIAGLFKCLCCLNPKDHKDDLHLLQIANSLEKLEKKLAVNSEAAEDSRAAINRRRSSVGMRLLNNDLDVVEEFSESEMSSEIPREERDDLSNPYWIEDPELQKGEVDFLTTAEIQFWKDLIDAYLRPIDENINEQNRIKRDLKALRDLCVFAFVMLNTLFVLVIFLLQLNQDQLHLKWPFGQSVTITYDSDINVIYLDQEYLMLEPIGSVFLIFFASVMMIQFIAMMFHRLGTLTHLLSAVRLDWYLTKRAKELSDDSILDTNAIAIVKDMQKLNSEDFEPTGDNPLEHVGRRKTIQNLEKARQSKPNIDSLDATFKRRFFNPNEEATARMSVTNKKMSKRISMRRATLRALETRRNSVLAEKRKSQMQMGSGAVYDYHTPRTTVNKMGRPSARKYSDAGGFINVGFEPAFDDDSDDDIMTMPQVPRKSQVTFKDSYS